jgi:hypothetical protein
MDQVVGAALAEVQKLLGRKEDEAVAKEAERAS